MSAIKGTALERIDALRREVIFLRDYVNHLRGFLEVVNGFTHCSARSYSMQEFRKRQARADVGLLSAKRKAARPKKRKP